VVWPPDSVGGYHGAAALGARGAQRPQPGLVTLLTQESVYYPVAAQVPSARVNLWTPEFNRFAPAGTVLLGPGPAAPNLGDVLSGFIDGLLVQPALPADHGRTLRYAVWQHGAAADQLPAARKNWVEDVLVNEMGAAV